MCQRCVWVDRDDLRRSAENLTGYSGNREAKGITLRGGYNPPLAKLSPVKGLSVAYYLGPLPDDNIIGLKAQRSIDDAVRRDITESA